MRDSHLEMSHRPVTAVPMLASKAGVMDQDELQPLLFDLVRADRLSQVKQLLPSLPADSVFVVEKLQEVAAGSASGMMMALLLPNTANFSGFLFRHLTHLGLEAARAGNSETSKYLAELVDEAIDSNVWDAGSTLRLGKTLKYALVQDSGDIWTIWEKKIVKHRHSDFGRRIAGSAVICHTVEGTANSELGEKRLKSLWLQLIGTISFSEQRISSALANVGHTTCSVNLATMLIQHGALVNYQPQNSYATVLQAAAVHDTLEAAIFMKFLLLQGANPTCKQHKVLKRGRAKSLVPVEEERGPRNISRWLGITWEELVAQVRSERQGKDNGSEL